MQRSREMGQPRQSPRAPLNLKTITGSDSNGTHRPVRDYSPKFDEHRRSPRSPLPECNQKKKGTRVADLEMRLSHAQEELRKLKEQLASVEAAKREIEETKDQAETTLESKPLEAVNHLVEEQPAGEPEKGGEEQKEIILEPVKSDALEGVECENESAENSNLQRRLEEIEGKVEELNAKLAMKEEELEKSRAEADELRGKTESLAKANEELEAEMKKLKVQMEQWRKAADAAAAILSGEDGLERSGRMVAGSAELGVGGEGQAATSQDAEEGTRRRSGAGGGIRMLGELWRRKGTSSHHK